MMKNLTMLTDYYEFCMANGYFQNRMEDKIACFDMFFRRVPDNGGFAENFLNYLKNFKFTCDVWAIPEGTPIFPGEPIVTIRGPVAQAQLIETMLLLIINHQSLIATKANRIVRAAQGRAVLEFGSRRAQGASGAIYGARAAYIAGVTGTACTISDREFGVPALGTMAHAWIQLFDKELDAFEAFAVQYPDNCTLLIDTYNALKSGVPNAIKAFDNVLKPIGKRPKGIRIDSGDITYLSKQARKMLDEAGYEDCKIVASNSLDEYLIRDMLNQGAKVDTFGVGERLITASSNPVFGGVYKLAAVESGGVLQPRIKVSENVAKITNPGFKKVYRLYEKASGKAIADVITLFDETIDDSQPYELFDPVHTWKRKTVTDYVARPLLEPVFVKGECVYESPALEDIRSYCAQQLATLWDEVTRFENPHKYYVDLSQPLWDLKDRLLEASQKF